MSWDLWLHPSGRHTWRDPSSPWHREPAAPWQRHGTFRLRRWDPGFGLLPGEAKRLPAGAICASTPEQSTGMGGPHLIYLDIRGTCRDCGAAFVFTAAEQQHWFEVLKLWNEIIPTACAACRRQRRAVRLGHARLAEALAALQETPGDAAAHLLAAQATASMATQIGLPSLQRGLGHARRAAADPFLGPAADDALAAIQAELARRAV